MPERNKRKTLIGSVSNRSGDKTVKVIYAYKDIHSRYGKVVNRRTVVMAHDGKNECGPGDKVLISETRPLSKRKRWRVARVLEKAALPEK